jgi:hypothetical protein
MEYVRGLRLILNTDLSVKNNMQASGSLTVPTQRCSLGIINWRYADSKVERKSKRNVNSSWTLSHKSRYSLVACFC